MPEHKYRMQKETKTYCKLEYWDLNTKSNRKKQHVMCIAEHKGNNIFSFQESLYDK